MNKKWEHKLRNELNAKLFGPRFERIFSILKEKPANRITGKDKSALYKALAPIVHDALKGRYKAELEGRTTKSFKLRANSPSKRKEAIRKKIKANESHTGNKFRKLIYTLWDKDNKCIYVGQTKRGLPEIVSKDERLYRQAVRLKIFRTAQTKLDRYEGIAYHVLTPEGHKKPKFNKIHTKNARKRCPFCRTERKVRAEICRALVLKRTGV